MNRENTDYERPKSGGDTGTLDQYMGFLLGLLRLAIDREQEDIILELHIEHGLTENFFKEMAGLDLLCIARERNWKKVIAHLESINLKDSIRSRKSNPVGLGI